MALTPRTRVSLALVVAVSLVLGLSPSHIPAARAIASTSARIPDVQATPHPDSASTGSLHQEGGPGDQDLSSYVDHDLLVDGLRTDYGISAAEARRRLEWQHTTWDFPQVLPAILGDIFAGFWIDQNDGGRTKIGVTDPPPYELQQLLDSRSARLHTDIVIVANSHDALIATVQWVRERMPTGAMLPVVSVGINHQLNRVVVEVPTLEGLVKAQRDVLDLAELALFDVIEVSEIGVTHTNRLSCVLNSCDPPLRGGVPMLYDHPGDVEVCTAGFTTRSKSDGKPYILTAGHCLHGTSNSWYTHTAAGTYPNIGPRHNSVFGNNMGDYGIARVANDTYWQSRPWVVVESGPHTTPNSRYVVQRTGFSSLGMRLCFTGTTTGTRCGEVDGLNQEITHDGIKTVGLGRMKGPCMNKGDSGGPGYSFGTAYGLMVAVSRSLTSGCRVYYQGVNGAANGMNVYVRTG